RPRAFRCLECADRGDALRRVPHVIASLLIANRGEIACRIARTAKRLGIRVIAIFSEADRDALHVELADEAVPIGPAPARQSYLNIGRIIAAARLSGVEAVHPGYGFLSENAEFAEACLAAGLLFIGPPAAAIRAMGSKAEAKRIMAEAGVPLVPGYHGEDQSLARLIAEAKVIGLPVLIKASAGGGGKGMRVVEREADFPEALAAAQREAASSFGDDRVLIEKYLARPRHIEVQIIADRHGRTISLFERDCSIQRRHQKIIEEAPAPDLPAAMRAALADAACAAARAVGYVNAGTVEFLAEGGHFYFMEMNTRLQVEHPVTEFVTGLDLVEWQIRVARGEPLPSPPSAPQGHAIEARLYAEDPARDFLPAAGHIALLRMPASAPWLRIDSGVRQGDAIGTDYDPMIGKLIVHGEDRADAVRKLRLALDDAAILGLRTNIPLLSRIAHHPAFAAGDLDTGFIPRHAEALAQPAPARETALVAAAIIAAQETATHAQAQGFRLNLPPAPIMVRLGCGGISSELAVHGAPPCFTITGEAMRAAAEARMTPGELILVLDDRRMVIPFRRMGETLSLWIGGVALDVSVMDRLAPPKSESHGNPALAAPMPGRLARILVSSGQAVTRGMRLAVMEAMKMELAIEAPEDGVIEAIHYPEGALVPEGAILFALGRPDSRSDT
ncbi:MAG TPA: biotin carboxylase N-terminal domain-containing protein, partial [Acetobacteraceae bacterium]|nr:biotin carboxylase N-terminal domain-containing protein [Acetobacteraceae bacterium]